jgi:YjbE family integral membrane protein
MVLHGRTDFQERNVSMDTTFWVGLVNIIVLDMVLSGDNAVVIGMAARTLPERQRRRAIAVGTAAAVLLRVALTGIAAWLLNIPLLMTFGAVLLVWIALRLLAQNGGRTHVSTGRSLKGAIKTIIVADVVMSLDNVVSVAAVAHGHLGLLIFGLGLSIPIIMWGSRLVALVINRLPWLMYAGAAILGYTAGQLIVEDDIVRRFVLLPLHLPAWTVPIGLTLLVLIAGGIMRSKPALKA